MSDALRDWVLEGPKETPDEFMCPPYTPMHQVLVPAESGEYKLEVFEMTEGDAQNARLHSVMQGRYDPIEPGKYMRLSKGNTMLMTDTPMERKTNSEAVYEATGNVLLGGLGLGMTLLPIVDRDEVKSVVIIEKEPAVIEMVWDQLWDYHPILPSKCIIINDDVFTWKWDRDDCFDTIFFDIWPNITSDNLDEMSKLHRRYARRKNKDGWMSSWNHWECKDLRRREKGMGW